MLMKDFIVDFIRAKQERMSEREQIFAFTFSVFFTACRNLPLSFESCPCNYSDAQ
jgi:hypothetical protein